MSIHENRFRTILGIFLAIALLAAPMQAYAFLDIWDPDDQDQMEPGDPEGGDRAFPDTPYDDPSGQSSFAPGGDSGDDELPDQPVIRMIPLLRDHWLIVTPLMKPGVSPYLLVR